MPRVLYDPPFIFEASSACLVVHKRDGDSSQPYRILPLSDAWRIYPEAMKLLAAALPVSGRPARSEQAVDVDLSGLKL